MKQKCFQITTIITTRECRELLRRVMSGFPILFAEFSASTGNLVWPEGMVKIFVAELALIPRNPHPADT